MTSPSAEIRSVQQDMAKLGRLAAYQLRLAMDAFRELNRPLAETIIEKDDVVDNLNLAIEDYCFRWTASGTLTADELRFARSAVKVAANLERVADAACHIAKRVRFIDADGIEAGSFDITPLEAIALPAVVEACAAYLAGDLAGAERVCGREPQLDTVYIELLTKIRARMRTHPGELIYLDHVQSVMKYLERVGDYVLNIGEQSIYRITGRRMKFEQYQQLDRLTGGSASEQPDFQPYWDGISGALVGRVELPAAAYLYKEGSQRKIEAEVQKSSEWERVLAGSTPRVVGVTTLGDREAMLREFVRGTPLVETLLSDVPYPEKVAVVSSLLVTVETVWRATVRDAPAATDYVAQTRARLQEVYALHPLIDGFSRNGRAKQARYLADAGVRDRTNARATLRSLASRRLQCQQRARRWRERADQVHRRLPIALRRLRQRSVGLHRLARTAERRLARRPAAAPATATAHPALRRGVRRGARRPFVCRPASSSPWRGR